MTQTVFVNRILNLKKIKFIGLDLDHTLIRYNAEHFEGLVYQFVITDLLENKNYPNAIKTFQFNFQDAIRGLVVDTTHGNILKLSRYAAIRQSYHGTHPIDFKEQQRFYRSVYVDLGDPNYVAVDTAFSIAFCVLYSQLVDYKDTSSDTLPSYHDIAHDVLTSVDKAHREGKLKQYIREHFDHFLIREPALVQGLQRYINHGKKLFILTDSNYEYTKCLLEYAIDPFLEKGGSWRDLFAFVITQANKPRFFYDTLSFLSIDPVLGTMTNTKAPIVPGIYQGGNATQFSNDLQLNGDEILYIGDHIYGDILRLKKHCNWRTALVVEELGSEIAAQKKAIAIEHQIMAAMNIKRHIEQAHIALQTQRIETASHQFDAELTAYEVELNALDLKISHLLQEQQRFYNPKWERVFRTGSEESYFAYQVERYACIYMEKLSDFFNHSPLTYFRSTRRLLAHDIEG